MKNLLILLVLLSATTVFAQRIKNKVEYIEFVNADEFDDKYVPPILISQKKLDIELDQSELQVFKTTQSAAPKITMEQFINLHYDLIVTDEKSYSTLLSFIIGHNQFYLDGLTRFNRGNSSIILTDGKTFYLYNKTKKEFFNQLSDSLKKTDCDKKLIFELSRVR
jgi:hypothetical protein